MTWSDRNGRRVAGFGASDPSASLRLRASSPLNQPDASRTDVQVQPRTSAAHDAIRVLWIDSDPLSIARSVSTLRNHGYCVDIAADGTTGLRLANADVYDAVIVDPAVPDDPCVSVVRRLRSIPDLLALVVLTAGHVPLLDRESLGSGITFYTKPISDGDLLQELQAAASQSSADTSKRGLFRLPDGTQSACVRRLVRGFTDEVAFTSSGLESAGRDVRLALLYHLAVLLADRITLFEYVAALRAFRAIRSGAPLESVEEYIRQQFEAAASHQLGTDISNADLLSICQCSRTTSGHLALALTVDCGAGTHDTSSHVKILEGLVGLRMSALRHAVAVRRAIEVLIVSDEHVRQIAYAVGYTHESLLDRHFKCLLGVTPTMFRRLCHKSSLSSLVSAK